MEPSGKSINVCDGIVRLNPGCPVPQADGSLRIQIDLWPTAYRFRRGQRMRVQGCSGAHPRFARNLGSGEPLATATMLQVADQTVSLMSLVTSDFQQLHSIMTRWTKPLSRAHILGTVADLFRSIS